jgi:DDE superfamily endonuclease
VTNLLGFGPDGMIIFGVINAPGSIHNSSLDSFFGIYEKLQAVYDKTGLKVIMDSAFCASEFEFITKLAHHFNSMEQMAINSAAMSMRQAAEWGMQALQGSFLSKTHFHSKMVLENCWKRCKW